MAISMNNPNTGASVLFAGDLPVYVKEADIESAFSHYNFAPVRVVWIRFTFSRGLSACLEFESADQADLAMTTVDLHPLPHLDPPVLLRLSRDLETPSRKHPQLPVHENGQYSWVHRLKLPPSCVGIERPLWNPPPNLFHVPVNAGCKDILHAPPELSGDTIPAHKTDAPQLVTESTPASGNLRSPKPPYVAPSADRACLSEEKTIPPGIELGLFNAEPQVVTLGPPSLDRAADVAYPEETDPPLVPQPGASINAPETRVNASPIQDNDLSISMPGTWCEKMKPFIAGEQTADTWTNLFHKLPADETGNLLVYLGNILFKLVSLLDEQRALRKTLKVEEEKVKIQQTVIHDQEVRHQEQARQQQEKTKSDLRMLDSRYAVHQRAELIKHGRAVQNAQAEHEIQLESITIELERFRTENLDLKESIDARATANQAISLERNSLKTELAELKEELKQVHLGAAASRAGRDRWHQSFLKADAGRVAKEGECQSLRSDEVRLWRENRTLTQEVESLRIEVSKHKLEEMRRREAEERRLREERRKEEEKRKLEEARREEEKRLLEEKRKQEEARKEEENRLREEEKRRQEEEERHRAEAERERQAKEAAEREQQARKGAAAAEDQRCRKRDTQRWGSKLWTPDTALERFHVVMAEFLLAKYSPMEPVTMRSIPWPILHSPDNFTFEEVTWENVELFLRHMKKVSASDVNYTKLLKQVQLMFHPDRWSSRNILQTVEGAEYQEALKKAGGTVSQAVNQWIDNHTEGNRATR